ncbi:MAG: sigma-70 family RNA polymerase sigma factor [Eubacteriales bacterium]
MDTDKILYDQFLRGDDNALEKLINTHKESLTLFIYGYLHNMTESENMMIDVFAQLVVSTSKFRGDATLKTYLFTIARNEALRYLKKNKHHLSLDNMDDNLLASADLIELDIFKEERNRMLYLCMKKLAQDYQDVLFLLYFEDMTYKEAAKIMKKSEKQITNLAYRGKKALKEKLEKEGFEYDE